MRLCLVRHGETAWNAEQRMQGWTDIPLNAQGERQARALAAALRGQAFDAIVASPLQRALHTAQAVAAGRTTNAVEQDARLRERHHGDLQGLTRGEIAAVAPAIHEALQARRPGYQPPGGESVEAFAARVHAAMQALRHRFHSGTVLAVAHGGVLDIAYRLATDADLHSPRQHALPNAAINWLRATPAGWAVEAWGQDDHLSHALDDSG